MAQPDMQDDDLLIRCMVHESARGQSDTHFFTVRRFPTDIEVEGPFNTKQVAIDVALKRGAEEGVHVWLELTPDSGAFQRISPYTGGAR